MKLTKQQIIASRTTFAVYDNCVQWRPQINMLRVLRLLDGRPELWFPGDQDGRPELWLPGDEDWPRR